MESDSRMAMDMLRNKCKISPHVLALLVDCTFYFEGIDITFHYTCRAGNFCVDYLANQGVKYDFSQFICSQ